MAYHRNKKAYAKNSVMSNSGKWSEVVIIQHAKTKEEMAMELLNKLYKLEENKFELLQAVAE